MLVQGNYHDISFLNCWLVREENAMDLALDATNGIAKVQTLFFRGLNLRFHLFKQNLSLLGGNNLLAIAIQVPNGSSTHEICHC